MIAPYDAIVRSVQPDLAEIGFELVADDRAGVTFKRGRFNLEINTEQYYHPTLESVLGYTEENGQLAKFHIATIMEVLAPDQLLKLRNNYDHQTHDGIKEALRFKIQFLKTHEIQVFQNPPIYLEACRKVDIDAARRAGFDIGEDGVLR